MAQSTNPVYDLVANHAVGAVLTLKQGRDYQEDSQYFRSSIIHALRRRGVRCRTRVSGREVHVTIIEKGKK